MLFIPPLRALHRCCRWFVVALFISGLSLAIAQESLEPISVKLKWKHQFQFAGLYAAIEKGFYEEAGFEVTLIEHDGRSDLFEPVINGDAEFGMADASLVIKRLQGAPVVVVTTLFQHSPLVMLTLKENGIRSPYEFIGKRLMFQRGADDASIQAMLMTLGIQPDDYELVPHNFDNYALLDESLDVDVMSAYASNQPYLYNARGYEVQVIDPVNYGIDFYGDLLYTSERYLRNNPDRVVAFRTATLRGWEYALNHVDEVIGWLDSDYPSSKGAEALAFEAEVIKQVIAKDFVALGTLYPERFLRIADVYKRLNMAPENENLDGFFLRNYIDSDESSRNAMLLRWVGIIAIVLALITLILSMIARSLQRTVKRRTRELDHLNQQLSRQVELTDRYVIFAEVDVNDRFINVSEAYCDVTGFSRDDLMARLPKSLIPSEYVNARSDIIQSVLTGESWSGEMQHLKKDGQRFWMQMFVDPLRDVDGTIIGYNATARDISEQKEIERLSQTDPLTGLANRMKLDLELGREWARYLRYHDDFAIVLVDLDHFKSINDTYGHQEGDRVLRAAASIMQTTLREVDILGRWGGEEFMAILPQTNLDSAHEVAEKLRKCLSRMTGLKCPPPTGSFGVASAMMVETSIEDLIRSADQALYKAKSEGRNRVISIRD